MSKVDINWDEICGQLDKLEPTIKTTKFTPDIARLVKECHKRGLSSAVIRAQISAIFDVQISRTAVNDYINVHKESWS